MLTFKITLIIIACIIVIYCLHLLCDWAESKGWIYYRKTKASGNALGASALELQNIFESDKSKYIIAAQESKQSETTNEGPK